VKAIGPWGDFILSKSNVGGFPQRKSLDKSISHSVVAMAVPKACTLKVGDFEGKNV
jgi:hypothetical protein